MNKFVKGSIAAAAGLVLLLGGAGSLAYWNADAGIDGGSIEAGTLTLEETAAGAWSPALSLWVPGDSSAYSTTLKLVATGDNIEGTVALDTASYTITPDTVADAFDITVAPGTLPSGITFDQATQTFGFDGAGTYTIPVTVTVDFPYGTTADNSSQGATVDFADLSFVATQTYDN
ncbi:alternate-type signal peptide domain-containing protein [Microbacterium marinilacus]|uniref:Alternate-type signal peptide domain-containing protein n=1 Tax=Microbacterium marinilacus TaxID=415209 RepID=A0ABP7BLH5_9MICO|nr:alternate-type signal peptide domain-containing protein [Microbacterium marinilacus]MBY0689691.1 alternate-type signal peptide domain-containing protein [Microbacterium marinilacus]